MRNTVFSLVHGRSGILWCMAVLLSVTFLAEAILAEQEGVDNVRLDETRPTEICKLLTNKTASEKAQIKSREIARQDFKGEYINTQYGVKVEIIGEVKEININGQSGIELFAKAWKGDKQLGFGKDGSVEIERFRIFNPPILVDDPNGDIVREWTDEKTGELKQRKLREDPIEAIRQTVAHNVKIVGKENAQIVIGKIGNTTSTFYPDAHPENTSHDAMLYTSPNASWDTVHDTANADGALDNYSGPDRFVYSGKDGDNFRIIRFQTLFDTSAIGSDTVSSATASLYVNLVNNGDNDGDDYIAVVSSNPASNTGAAVGDYSLMGTTAYSNTIDLSSMSTGDYVDWTINATGLAAINTSGITKFGFREGHDIIDSAYAGGFDTVNSIVTYAAEASGTANDPKLVVVHSTPTPTPTPTPIDTSAPSGSISINSGDSYTNSTSVNLTLSATDNVGVTGYYLSTSSTKPSASDSGWVSVSSTTSFSTSISYALSSGDGSKTLYAWYKDSGGNVSDTASDSIILDTTSSTVTITNPTTESTYTTMSSTINLGGTASDSTSGVNSVTWSNNRGGIGTAGGTTNWIVSSISLSYGDNIITVTATDGAGNPGKDTITVNYIHVDTPPPTPSPTPCTDDYEPNNSFSTAYGPLTSGNSYTGRICSASDVDYFKIIVDSAGTISLTLGVPSNRDYDLYLYDALQNEVALSQKDTGITETISYDTSTTGTYYIKVVGFQNDYDESQAYTLSGTWSISDETGDIYGRVTDAKAGTGINGATVSTDTGKSTTTSRQRGQDGAYVLQDVTAGVRTITATASGYASSSQSVTVDSGEQERLDFVLTSATTPPPTPTTTVSPVPTPTFTGSIEGEVVNQTDGKPIAGASVVLDSKANVTKTDTIGHYRFDNVSVGQHKITAGAKGFKQSEIETITVIANQTAHQNFFFNAVDYPNTSGIANTNIIANAGSNAHTAM